MNKRTIIKLFGALLVVPSVAFTQNKELSTVQTIRIKAPPDAVWVYVGDFGGFSRWFPGVQSSKLVLKATNEEGAIRELLRANGTKIREKLVAYDPGAMTLTYTFADGLILAQDYFSTMALKSTGTGETEVTWSGRFKRLDSAPPEQDDAALVALFTGIYKRGLDSLKATVEGTK